MYFYQLIKYFSIMNYLKLFCLAFLLVLFGCIDNKNLGLKNQKQAIETHKETKPDKSPSFGIALHGGAGFIKAEMLNDSITKVYENQLSEAIEVGHQLLAAGEGAEKAVVEVIQLLEASPLFNAGVGAVLNADGVHELDASIMHGKNLEAGAVAGIRTIKSPILLAQKVMNESNHVLLSGNGAEDFAILYDLKKVENSYFSTDKAKKSLQNAQNKSSYHQQNYEELIQNHKFGTVGCVALDQEGNLVAGTSTGGMTNKKYGRIGDSPIIGAGNYANNSTCAISATGHGEYFIRNVVAHDISAMMEYGDFSLEQATHIVIHEKLKNQGGDGGVIAIDSDGNISIEFNTEGMFRAQMDAEGNKQVNLFKK